MSNPDADIPGAIFDALDTGIAILDGDLCVVTWNDWMISATDIPVQQARGKTLDHVFPEAKLRRLTSAIGQALDAGASSLLTHTLHGTIFPLKTRAGQKLIHNVSVRPIGQKPYTQCLVHIADVTLAAQRERVLRERQNARYDAVVDSASDGIITLDSEGYIRLANPAVAAEFGFSMEELIGQKLSLLLDDAAPWNAVWNIVVKGGTLQRPVEVVGRRKNGSPSHIEISASRWMSDQRPFVTAILRDVNERREAEEALRQLNQTLELRVAERTADRDRMWRLSNDVMFVARMDGTINAVNPAWTQLFGWEESRLVGAYLSDFMAEEDHGDLAAALAGLRDSPAPQLFESRLRTQDGDARVIAWSVVAGDGLIQAVGRDVTAERESAAALKNAEDALRQAQKMEAIGQLTGGIAHDFNNLLTGIIGSIDAIKRRVATNRFDDIQRFMDAAVTSSNRAASLTHRLLAFARRQPLDPKAVNANQLIRGIEDLLRRTLGEQVQMTFGLAPDLWPTLADAHQLENAILNLAINARDAMPKGGRLAITTSTASFSSAVRIGQDEIEPGDYSVIAVSDTGIGMTPEILAKVFEPFFTTKPIGEGTGLGLSMIYGFVRQSRGHVKIDSRPGEGTTIYLYLPRHYGEVIAEDATPREDLPKGAGETVLLVEDDPAVRLLIAEVLRDLGYTCIETHGAQAALPMLTSNARLDLLITDVGLPGMNGRELADIARKHRPNLKVLFVTGYAEHATGDARFLAPGMEMVTKPFALDALALKISQMIGKG